MNREQVLTVIVKNLKLNVDGLDDKEIDPGRSMADYGAMSLDMVEIVNTSMADLRISVPRTKLAGLKNINELVDLFLGARPEQPCAAHGASSGSSSPSSS